PDAGSNTIFNLLCCIVLTVVLIFFKWLCSVLQLDCHSRRSRRHTPIRGREGPQPLHSQSATFSHSNDYSPTTCAWLRASADSAPKARFVARRKESISVSQLGRPLTEYMSLPASQYSVLDADREDREGR
ncbi:unnamed protein product, partial [Linum tenue]